MRVQKRFVELLEEAKISESPAVPDGNPEAILIRALELLIDKSGKINGVIPVKSNKRTEKIKQDPDSAHVTAGLYREVMARDEYSCRWPMADGGRCESKDRLEPDHINPRARGGKTEAANLRVLCHAHNAQAAREQFGVEFVAERIRQAQVRKTKRAARTPAAGREASGEAEGASASETRRRGRGSG